MSQFLKTIMQGLALSVGVFLAGCQSSGQSTAAAPQMLSVKAVHCEKCKTTIVNAPSTVSDGRRESITVYGQSKAAMCPNCCDAAKKFFTTGKLEHTCTACGSSMGEIFSWGEGGWDNQGDHGHTPQQ
jgi:nitrous oxide reductase accessory protein NosL